MDVVATQLLGLPMIFRRRTHAITPYSGHWARLTRVVERDMQVCAYAPPNCTSPSYDQLQVRAPRGCWAVRNLPTTPHPLIAPLARARKAAAPPLTRLPRHTYNAPLYAETDSAHLIAPTTSRERCAVPRPLSRATPATSRGRAGSACGAVRRRERPEEPSPLFDSSQRARLLLEGVVTARSEDAGAPVGADALAAWMGMSSTPLTWRVPAMHFALLVGACRRESRGHTGSYKELRRTPRAEPVTVSSSRMDSL